ncbi:hypothetical protein D3C80_1773220 [compost metagenome]
MMWSIRVWLKVAGIVPHSAVVNPIAKNTMLDGGRGLGPGGVPTKAQCQAVSMLNVKSFRGQAHSHRGLVVLGRVYRA